MASAESPSRVRRLRNMDAGAEAGKAWLEGVFRSGIGSSHGLKGFKEIEQRMVDAQAAGFARRFWLLGELAQSGGGWQDRFVEEAGLLYLMLNAFLRRDTLSEPLREEILRGAGITVDRRQLELLPQIEDIWDLAVQRNFKEQRLFARQSWMFGRESKQWVCIQQYRIATQEFDVNYSLGAGYHGTVALYPGSAQTRAALLSHEFTQFALPPVESFRNLTEHWADLLTRYPWAESLGSGVSIKSLSRDGERWIAKDDEGAQFPIADAVGWRVAAYLGCRDPGLFGEWDGREFKPSAITAEGGFYAL